MNAPKLVEAESLAQAMALAFAEIESATKAANNPHFKSKYADLTSVIEAIKPALVAHNLFFTQHPRPNEQGVEIETVLHHAGGETFSLGSLFVPADRNNAQGFGSALTYARRYALVTAFGVPVEDDDGNAAAKAPPTPKAQTAKKPAQHSALKTELRGFVHELNGCGDADQLNAFLKTADALRIVRETREKLPHLWDGNDWPEGLDRPEEFVPLAEVIDRRTRECAEATARYLTA